MRITSNNIQDIQPDQIFVFGSNLAGKHGKGAAKVAMSWGAKFGCGHGLYGNTYAIPTKDKFIKTLPISEIKQFVDIFIEFAKNNSQYTFLVTEIGCGLAGYSPCEISVLFEKATLINNIHLPESFWQNLRKL